MKIVFKVKAWEIVLKLKLFVGKLSTCFNCTFVCESWQKQHQLWLRNTKNVLGEGGRGVVWSRRHRRGTKRTLHKVLGDLFSPVLLESGIFSCYKSHPVVIWCESSAFDYMPTASTWKFLLLVIFHLKKQLFDCFLENLWSVIFERMKVGVELLNMCEWEIWSVSQFNALINVLLIYYLFEGSQRRIKCMELRGGEQLRTFLKLLKAYKSLNWAWSCLKLTRAYMKWKLEGYLNVAKRTKVFES